MIAAPVMSCRVACSVPLGVAHRQPKLLRGMVHQRLQLQQAAPLAKARRRPVAVKAQADAGGEGAPGQRHAFLHDFCMCIPYGGLVTLGGLVMMLFGVGQVAKLIAGAGVSMLALSTLSLKSWRAQQPAAKLFTLLEAGMSGGLTYFAYRAVQQGAPLIPHAPLGLLSALMTLFLVYNILAGGNPPPKEKPAAVAA